MIHTQGRISTDSYNLDHCLNTSLCLKNQSNIVKYAFDKLDEYTTKFTDPKVFFTNKGEDINTSKDIDIEVR